MEANDRIKLGVMVIAMLALLTLGYYLFTFISKNITEGNKREMSTTYKGIVVEKGKDIMRNEILYYVILEENIEQERIRINVSVPNYYKCNINQEAEFSITNRDMYYFGNTKSPTLNLYEQ